MPPECPVTSTTIEQLEQALLKKLERGDIELPLLPQVASQVMALTSDPSADAAKLSALIHQDQALAAHVLRIANSPAYCPEAPSPPSSMPSPCWGSICCLKSRLPHR